MRKRCCSRLAKRWNSTAVYHLVVVCRRHWGLSASVLVMHVDNRSRRRQDDWSYRCRHFDWRSLSHTSRTCPKKSDISWSADSEKTTALKYCISAVFSDAESIRHGGHVPHFYKWLGTGGTVNRRTANKKLAKLYWPSRKRLPKRLIMLIEPKKWRGTTKKIFFRRFEPDRCPHFQIRPGATGCICFRESWESTAVCFPTFAV